MPIADFNAYLDLARLNRGADFQTTTPNASTVARMVALWRLFASVPAAPTTSVALDSTSDVAIGPIPASSTGKLAVLAGRLNTLSLSGVALTVVDVLNHSGGLSGTVTTEQTTNLPTAALTRYTNGEGVMAALVIYTNVGATATTATIRYTNQAGTGNQVSTAIAFGGAAASGAALATRLFPIPLAAGDTGVRSVEGVTLAGTTGTVGNFGVVLFRPLTMFALENTSGAMPIDAVTGGMIGSLVPFDDTACLSCIVISAEAQAVNGTLLLGEA